MDLWPNKDNSIQYVRWTNSNLDSLETKLDKHKKIKGQEELLICIYLVWEKKMFKQSFHIKVFMFISCWENSWQMMEHHESFYPVMIKDSCIVWQTLGENVPKNILKQQ